MMLLEQQKAPVTLSDAPGGTERPRNAHKDTVSDALGATERSCDPHRYRF